MQNNYAVPIHPGCAPERISIPYGVEGLLESFRIVEKENELFAHGKQLEPSVMQLNDKAHLIYIEDGNKCNLLPNRTIGRVSLYGTMLIINLDKYDEMVEMNEIEAHHFAMYLTVKTSLLPLCCSIDFCRSVRMYYYMFRGGVEIDLPTMWNCDEGNR